MKYDTFLPLAVEIKKVKLSLLEFLSIKKFYKFISSDRSSFTSDSPLPHSEQTPVFCALSKCGDSELPIFNKSTRHRVVLSPKPAKFQQISTIKTNCSPLASVCFQYVAWLILRRGHYSKMASRGGSHVLLTGTPGTYFIVCL